MAKMRYPQLVPGLLMAVLVACAPAAPSPGTVANRADVYTCQDHSFTATLPQDWKREEDRHPYGDLTRITGVRLASAPTAEGVPVTISVLHYSGEGLFKTPDDFIRNELNSIARTDYDQPAPLREIRIAGRTGRTFQMKTFELVRLDGFEAPPGKEGVVYELAPPHRRVEMLERYIVLPAREGYFVLGCRSPERVAGEYQRVFEAVARSFRPLP